MKRNLFTISLAIVQIAVVSLKHQLYYNGKALGSQLVSRVT